MTAKKLVYEYKPEDAPIDIAHAVYELMIEEATSDRADKFVLEWFKCPGTMHAVERVASQHGVIVRPKPQPTQKYQAGDLLMTCVMGAPSGYVLILSVVKYSQSYNVMNFTAMSDSITTGTLSDDCDDAVETLSFASLDGGPDQNDDGDYYVKVGNLLLKDPINFSMKDFKRAYRAYRKVRYG